MLSRFRARLVALHGLKADLAAFGLGVLAAAALPPVHAVPVLLLAVPGLLVLIDGARTPALAARRGWWFGLGHHIIGLYWVTEAILYEAARFWWLVPLAVPALAATLAVFIAAACAAARCAPRGWPRAVALAGAWVLADIARQFVLTGFPWNPWGSVWEFPGGVGDIFIQPAAWVGVPGLTLATVLLAAVPLLGRRWRLGGAVFLAAWAIAGAARLVEPVLPPATPLTVVLVQGDVAEGQKFDRAFAARIFTQYLELTKAARARIGDASAVFVWPETAFPGLLDLDLPARQVIAATTGGAPSLIGSIRFDGQRRPRNSLFAVAGNATIGAVYDKLHLVPFGEYVPDWLPVPIQVVPGHGLAPGDGARTLHLPGLPAAGALICYEAIFPGQVVDAADRPAWLVNVTNDAWFGNSTGPRQHLAAARMRAVEEGLPLMRAANTGISAGFDARGHELGRIGMQRSGTLALPLPGALPPTWFARFGLWVPGIAASVALAFGIAMRRFTT